MAEQTVTLCIEDDDRKPMPFAVVPFSWVQKYQGTRRFKFPVPSDEEQDEPDEVDISVDITQIQLPNGGVHTSVKLWCKDGAEFLVSHPHVATYPEARAKVIAGMN